MSCDTNHGREVVKIRIALLVLGGEVHSQSRPGQLGLQADDRLGRCSLLLRRRAWWLASSRRGLKANRPTTLIQRFATTDEVANMIVYLCSEQSSATTGAALRVDGGVVRFIA